jgi:hypothetical protein
MTKYNIHVIDTEADGSFCTTDSQRHVDVVSGTGAAIGNHQASERGDTVTVWDTQTFTPDSRHGITATESDDDQTDTHAQARHRC